MNKLCNKQNTVTKSDDHRNRHVNKLRIIQLNQGVFPHIGSYNIKLQR